MVGILLARLLPGLVGGTLLLQGLLAQEPIFQSDARLVVVHATVTDKKGHLLTDLPKSAFTLYENGIKQDLTVFRREDIPISLGLIIDNSASMREKRERVASAALALVKASNPDDEVFIMNFSEEPSLEKDFTSDIKELEKALKARDFHGGTAMRDALRMGIEHLKHRAKKDKKVLLVVTDGDDNSSIETLTHLVEVAVQNDVMIYAVGLLGEEQPREVERAKRALDSLTQATGGQAYYPAQLSEIDSIVQNVAHNIRNQYTLGYSPTNEVLDGSFRKIRVVVDGPVEAVVRARAGYYARPEGPSAKSRSAS